jgi:hypothetical protein
MAVGSPNYAVRHRLRVHKTLAPRSRHPVSPATTCRDLTTPQRRRRGRIRTHRSVILVSTVPGSPTLLTEPRSCRIKATACRDVRLVSMVPNSRTLLRQPCRRIRRTITSRVATLSTMSVASQMTFVVDVNSMVSRSSYISRATRLTMQARTQMTHPSLLGHLVCSSSARTQLPRAHVTTRDLQMDQPEAV